MDSKQKIYIGGGLVVLLIALVLAGLFFKFSQTGQSLELGTTTQEVSIGDPLDIALDFYNPWLEALKSTSTNPYQSELATAPILSRELSSRLVGTKGHEATAPDPVLCQVTVPERVTGRVVSGDANTARVLVMAKDRTMPEQSVFTLKHLNDGWYIDDITCSGGEFAPDREFTFDNEGFLLKSVPPPLDSKYWYVVYEENHELGHFAPLFLDAESKCIATDKTETVCSEDQFSDAKKVHVYGQMTELGVEVKKIEFVE